jgi:glycosyltransferase involved in cell wall biosynthesis
LSTMPVVTVVISTWNRGALLLPTLKSVLQQSFKDFEIIIVGDGCTDDTEEVIAPFLNDRVRWINLPHNCGVQSFPNNVGIAKARGCYIAYLGHDDIWDKHHLQSLTDLLQTDHTIDFAVAGMIFHGPPDSDFEMITGLFESDDAKFKHVFPPGSVMHKRACVKKIGLWRGTNSCRAPIDWDFQIRAANAGCRYASTGGISVHKFSAAQRYLYYLEQSCSEQQAMLEALDVERPANWFEETVAKAKRLDRFMNAPLFDCSHIKFGEIGERNRLVRGLKMPPLKDLVGVEWIEQTEESRGLDWFNLDPGKDYRWAGPSPRPKILIPFVSNDLVQFGLLFHHINDFTLSKLKIMVNGEAISHKVNKLANHNFFVEFESKIFNDKASVVELYAPHGVVEGTKISLALRKTMIAPLDLSGF